MRHRQAVLGVMCYLGWVSVFRTFKGTGIGTGIIILIGESKGLNFFLHLKHTAYGFGYQSSLNCNKNANKCISQNIYFLFYAKLYFMYQYKYIYIFLFHTPSSYIQIVLK